MFAYGYFCRRPDRTIVPCGKDFGPTLSTYKVGDSVGVRGQVEGFVIGVLTGKAAKMSGGFDVFVLVEERSVSAKGASPPPPWNFFERDEGKEYLEKLLRGPDRLVSRPQIQTKFQGQNFRAVGNKLYPRPLNETFFDFQIHHLLWQLGKQWFDQETAKPVEQRHIILKWRTERNEQLQKYKDPKNPDAPARAPITGGMRALQVLADDVYQLAHALDPPRKVLARLRDMTQFQGARYEILVASLFARCKFNVTFIDDASKRNPEFVARSDAERIAVEAKSRHRAGVLHERGEFREDASAKIRELYDSAAGQNPGDCPFLIFIDVNFPLSPGVEPSKRPWVAEAMKAFEDREKEGLQNKDTGLIMTNFGWHFSREENTPPGENYVAMVQHPKFPIKRETWELLLRALSEYGIVTDQA